MKTRAARPASGQIMMNADRDSLRARARAFAFSPDSAGPGFEIRGAAEGGDTAEILLYDEIGYWGITATDFVTALAGVTAKQIALRINSPGGDVIDGMAMFNALRRHPATVTATIDGIAASAASVVMLGADTIAINESAMVMIHEPWGIVMGGGDELRDFAARLDRLTEQYIGVYMARTGQDADQIAAWMKDETWFFGAEAVAAGFADTMIENPGGGKKAKALTDWDLRAFKNAPATAASEVPAPAVPETPDPVDTLSPPRVHMAALRRAFSLERLRG